MTESERRFTALLEERGFVHFRHYWFEDEIFEAGKLPRRRTTPDFFLEKGGKQLIVEIKQLDRTGVFVDDDSEFAHAISGDRAQKELVDRTRVATRQIGTYRDLRLPSLIVFFDNAMGTHMLDEWQIQTLFGVPMTIFGKRYSRDFRGGGRVFDAGHGRYVSALAILDNPYFGTGESGRLVIQLNPYAEIVMPSGLITNMHDNWFPWVDGIGNNFCTKVGAHA